MKCPRCDRPRDDHTIAQLAECSPLRDLNLPFEATPGGPQEIPVPSNAVLAAGTVVAALRVETPLGVLPALRLTFTADGIHFGAPVIQVFDDAAKARDFSILVHNAVEEAIKAARS